MLGTLLSTFIAKLRLHPKSWPHNIIVYPGGSLQINRHSDIRHGVEIKVNPNSTLVIWNIAIGAYTQIASRDFSVIGDSCRIGRFSILSGNFTLGTNVVTGPFVSIISDHHDLSLNINTPFKGSIDLPNNNQMIHFSVVIADGVFLGLGSTLFNSCSIGSNSLVRAHSVVKGTFRKNQYITKKSSKPRS